MHLKVRNVNGAFNDLVRLFAYPGERLFDKRKFDYKVVRKPSRNGAVLQLVDPVMITYSHPWEKVLFNQARDTNPASLLYESLWMLAGRQDVASLAYYTPRFRDYSDDDKTLNDAYGYRWRAAGFFGGDYHPQRPDYYIDRDEIGRLDQLDLIVHHLRAQPNSRRAVLQIWNVEDDLLKIGGTELCRTCKGDWTAEKAVKLDEAPPPAVCPNCEGNPLNPFSGRLRSPLASKAVACNTHAYFSIRTEYDKRDSGGVEPWGAPTPPFVNEVKFLDMTVCNRSNDLLWGLTNANYVTFATLLEYMAARIGVEPGLYHHVTNNLHAYQNEHWKPQEWLEDREKDWYQVREQIGGRDEEWTGPMTVPLVKDPETFERELQDVVKVWDGTFKHSIKRPPNQMFDEPFFQDVARPMLTAFARYKHKEYDDADEMVEEIKADDWRIVVKNWFSRRRLKRAGANGE
jgi:thymidylate synthase